MLSKYLRKLHFSECCFHENCLCYSRFSLCVTVFEADSRSKGHRGSTILNLTYSDHSSTFYHSGKKYSKKKVKNNKISVDFQRSFSKIFMNFELKLYKPWCEILTLCLIYEMKLVSDEGNMKLDLVLVVFHNDTPYKSLKTKYNFYILVFSAENFKIK